MTPIYYWKGASGSQNILVEHRSAILRLLQQDYATSDLEKLRGNHQLPIYSFRLNAADRLLFTTRVLNGSAFLHVLEYIPNHDYQKSRFRKRKVLRDYLAKLDLFEPDLAFEPLCETDSKPSFNIDSDSRAFEAIGLEYYNQQFIAPHDEQQHISKLPLPLILSGLSGCGKTFIGHLVVKQFIEAWPEDVPAHILYLTKEASLASSAQDTWNNFCDEVPDSIKVEHRTYVDVFKQYTGCETESNERHHFDAWLQSQKASSICIDDRTLYKEFRICSAYSLDAYLSLGEHQSSLNPVQRAELYQHYERFQDYLRSNKLIDPVFFSLPKSPSYHLIIVDEAQLLNLLQLQNIYGLSINHAILYCMDPHQNLVDQTAIRLLLQQLHWSVEHGARLQTVQLNTTYRCPQQVANIVNALLSAKHHLMGTIDKTEARTLLIDTDRADEGEVYFCSKQELNQHATVLDRHTTTEFAVVTHPQLIAEAQQLFNTPLVFTIEQIQGLEYPTVVIYQLCADTTSQANLKRIHADLETIETHKRSKQDKQSHQDLAAWFNTLYTAFTRAQQTLLICEETPKRHNALFKLLKNAITPANKPVLKANSSDIIPPAQTNWAVEATRQEQHGNIEVAERIRARFASPSVLSTPNPQLIPNTPSLKKKAKKNKRKEPLTETQAQKDARTIYETFKEPGVISRFVQRPDFLTIMFETDCSLGNLPPQKLAAHLFDFNEFTKRFVIAMGLTDLGFIDEAFVLKLIQLSTLPQLIIDKLIRHLLTADNQLLNNDLIRAWVKRQFNTISVIRCFERCINSDEYVNFFNALDPDKPDPLMTPFAFAQFLSYINLTTGGTPLLMLAMHFKPLLNKIITDSKHRDMIDAIPPIIWGIPCKPSTGEHENTSPIYRLSESDEGHDILCSLIERYPTIINAIPIEVWSRPLTTAAGSNENASPLYHLCFKDTGHKVLEKLLCGHPDIIRAIPQAAWALANTAAAGAYENTSPLYFLTHSSSGCALLSALMDRCPEVISHIPTSAWSLPMTKASGSYLEHATPLYWLTKTRESRAILIKLIDRFPEVIRAIPVSTWNQKMQYLGNRNTKVSLLEWIFLQSDCLGTVEKLFIVNPALDPKMIRGARYPRFLTPSTSNQGADSLNTAETDLSSTLGI